VSRLRLRLSISLDGYVAGPNQSVPHPLGEGGEDLHQWVFPLAAWRKPHGLEGGKADESTPVLEEELTNLGATIMGRNMFGGHPGPWDRTKPWMGWWGTRPPFHHPVFVVTTHARAPLEMEGGTVFTFVTDGIEQAYELARRAAKGKDLLWREEPTSPSNISMPAWWTRCSSISSRSCWARGRGCSRV